MNEERGYKPGLSPDAPIRSVKSIHRIPVPVRDLRRLRYLVEVASRLVHSNGRMMRDEKVAVLKQQADCKKILDNLLQLSLFPASQLEE